MQTICKPNVVLCKPKSAECNFFSQHANPAI
jgi:hypothetical protein